MVRLIGTFILVPILFLYKETNHMTRDIYSDIYESIKLIDLCLIVMIISIFILEEIKIIFAYYYPNYMMKFACENDFDDILHLAYLFNNRNFNNVHELLELCCDNHIKFDCFKFIYLTHHEITFESKYMCFKKSIENNHKETFLMIIDDIPQSYLTFYLNHNYIYFDYSEQDIFWTIHDKIIDKSKINYSNLFYRAYQYHNIKLCKEIYKIQEIKINIDRLDWGNCPRNKYILPLLLKQSPIITFKANKYIGLYNRLSKFNKKKKLTKSYKLTKQAIDYVEQHNIYYNDLLNFDIKTFIQNIKMFGKITYDVNSVLYDLHNIYRDRMNQRFNYIKNVLVPLTCLLKKDPMFDFHILENELINYI